ncbi:MAG: transcriptional regulator MntR [Nitrososphaerales archaeon]|nr:transcriptional regulator MntR [Nitrososphaerales archaeon]
MSAIGDELAKVTQIEQQEEMSRLEDYLEVIYHLVHEKGFASTVDIAESLRVKPPSVSSMLQRLASRDYLVHEPYRGIRLTDKGTKTAKSVIKRHSIISELLLMLGVEEKVAYQDTEGIEHHIQPVTISRVEGLVDFLRKNPKLLRAIRNHMKEY